jgi:AraC-like DNA-binding protein
VEDLAKSIYLSRSQLNRKLKALTGLSPTLFIRSLRLHKAKRLLQAGQLDITEIAFAVGFKDLAYFSRVFSKEFGKSPKNFIS